VLTDVFAIARDGMATQARRVEAAAQTIASLGATPPSGGAQSAPSAPPVRIGDLPVGDTIEEAIVTLVEAQAAYRANALVIKVASDMFDSLLDAVDSDCHCHRR
jgi:flagellar basal body rod protein FlgC